MEKIWLQHYQDGVSHEIDPTRYETLVDLLKESIEHYWPRIAFSNLGTSMTYGDVDTQTRAFAAFLQQELDLKKGDRIALMIPNLLQYPIAMFGALRAGCAVINVNPLYTPKELSYLLEDSGANTIVILVNFAHVLQQALTKNSLVKHIIFTEVGDLFPQPKSSLVDFVVRYIKRMIPAYSLPNAIHFKTALRQGAKALLTPVKLSHRDLAYLQYTGGTTGKPKAAMLSHRNIVANVLQLVEWVKPSLQDEQPEIVVTALPLYHIFSLTVNCLAFTAVGGHNLLITNPRDIAGFIKAIQAVKFTAIAGVNTLFNAMLNHDAINNVDFSRLKIAIAGGMALQQSVAEKWQEVTGCVMVEGYGLTEASPVVSANRLNIAHYHGSIGMPLPSTDIAICDERGNELGINHEGELLVKGPQVMCGYWQNEDETKATLSEDGWLRTGDIAKVDEIGRIHLVDRKKDMIIVSGFNVYPNEVEDVIATHPGVLEVAVIGVPDARSGEKVKAFVVKKDANLQENDIIEYCQKSLTRYKIPKLIEFREALPKTNVGKILRRALRD